MALGILREATVALIYLLLNSTWGNKKGGKTHTHAHTHNTFKMALG